MGRVGFLVGCLGRVVLVSPYGFMCWYAGYGDAGRGGVLAQAVEGGDAGFPWRGRYAVGCDQGDGAAGGEADGGPVGAEELAEEAVGHAEPLVAGGGGHDRGV